MKKYKNNEVKQKKNIMVLLYIELEECIQIVQEDG